MVAGLAGLQARDHRDAYLILIRLTGRMALVARSAASNDAGLLMPRQEVAVLRRQNPWRAISSASNAQ